MSVDPRILALIVRRTRQLKRVKYPPTQETIIEYVTDRLDVTEEAVRVQLELAVQNGQLKERAPQNNKNYVSYTFPDGINHTSPLAKSPSPGPNSKVPKRPYRPPLPPLKSPPLKSPTLKSPASTAPALKTPASTAPVVKSPASTAPAHRPLLKSPLKNDARPELVIDEGKDLSKHIKTALLRMERPYGSSIKVLMQYFDSRFKVKIKVGKDEDRDKALHRAVLKSAILGLRRGILTKVERMFRIAPLQLYKEAPEGPITEKLKSAFLTLKKEKERAKKPVTRNILCSFCMKPEAENREGKHESMVSCCTCGNSGHPSCLKWSEELTTKVRSLPSWECLECKWCSVCREAGNDSMLFCDTCDRGFHLECCEPALSKPPKGDWSCLLCLFERYDAEQAKVYLESHKFSPRRRPSLVSAVKYSISPTNKKTPKKKKDEDGSESKSSSEEDDLPLRSSSAEGTSTNGSGRKKGRNGDDSLVSLAKVAPGQLNDSLSKFFTPSNKRQSLVARKSFESLVALARERKQQKNNRQAADKLVKKSRKELNKQTLNEKIKQQQAASKNRQRTTSTGDETERTDDSLPEHCTSTDMDWFRKSEQEAKKAIEAAEEAASPDSGRYPPVIVFGRFQIQTWYSAPYPQEYAKLPKLWICEFCLQYAKSRSVLERHMVKCDLRSPPGDEIYRNGALSVYEVDGQTSKLYCQNLCLLAKLFLDHKTLYYDVEPFLFYVLTVNDQYGSHLAGYFSKEKHCAQKYNVSCIMILPTYQRTGYGRFLVSFSYLLSRQEKQPGTPERPLSELGRIAYQAYWRDQVLEYLVKNPDTPSLVIHDISQRTGMSPHDIAATMQELGLVRTASDGSDRLVVVVDEAQLRDYKDRIAKKPPIATVEPTALRWTPPVCTQNGGVPSLAPPPMHNEFIEHMKANPPVEQQKKKRKRKRKMSPWRRQRQITAAARKKRLLERSKLEAEEEEDDEDGKQEEEEEESESEKEGGEVKKVKREARSRKREETNGKRDQSTSSSESESEDEDEDVVSDDDDDDGGDEKKPDPDDDSGSSGSSSSSSSNGEGPGGPNGGGGGGSNNETESQSGSSYTTASDSGAREPVAQPPPSEEGVLKAQQQVEGPRSRLRSSTVVQQLRPIKPRPIAPRPRPSTKTTTKPLDTKSKENDQSAAVVVEPLQTSSGQSIVSSSVDTESNSGRSSSLLRPSSSASASTTSKLDAISAEQQIVTITRPLPSTKETIRARRSGIKPHRLVSVLHTEDPLLHVLHRKTGPVARPGRVSSVGSMTLGTTPMPMDIGISPMPGQMSAIVAPPVDPNSHHYVMVDEFTTQSSTPSSMPSVIPTAPPTVQTSPSVQSKVEAAVATFRKEQKVLTELAPTVGAGDVQMMPIMPISFFSSNDLVSDEMALPPPPSATVATIATTCGGGGGYSADFLSSSEFTTLCAPKFATLKAPSPPKNTAKPPPPQNSVSSSQISMFGQNNGISSQFAGVTQQQANNNTYSALSFNYPPNSYVNHATSSQVQPTMFAATSTAYSQPTPTSYYNAFLMAPTEPQNTTANFDLSAAAASLIQSPHPFFAKHSVVQNGTPGNNGYFYPQSVASPQPAAAPVYQALGGINHAPGQTQQQFLQYPTQHQMMMMPSSSSQPQQQFAAPNLHTKWL